MNKNTYRRKNYLINKNLQLSYTGMLIFYVLFITFILGFAIWYLNKEYLDVFYKIAGENAISKEYIKDIENQFIWKLALGMGVIAILLFFVGIYTSNRYAGPLYRLTKYLNLIGIENSLSTVKIRKKDHLQELAKAFNNMIDSLESKTKEDIKVLDSLKGKISHVISSAEKGSTTQESLMTQMKEIEELANQLSTKKN